MAELNNIKQLDGQPWSSWKKICSNIRTGDGSVRNNETSHCMKLNRADMPIYGLCPKTEVFELIVCNYCGLKYKLPAFAEHINLRHRDDKGIGTTNIDKPVVQKKGKIKRPKEKLKLKSDSLTLKVDMNMKINYLEIVSDRQFQSQSLTIDSETVSKITHLHANINKTNLKSCESNIPSKEENGVSNNGGCNVIKESDLNIEVISKKLKDSSVVKTPDTSSSPLPQGGELVNMQPVVKLSPISSNKPLYSSNVLSTSDQRKSESDSEKRHSVNLDVNCGVVDVETGPCMQSLDCKLHSSVLKKSVSGRSKPFDILLSTGTTERSTIREKCRIQIKAGPSSEITSVVPKGRPSNTDNNSFNLLRNEKKSEQVPNVVVSKETRAENRKQCESVNEDNVISSRRIKRNTNDLQGLSLPVSIKNPSILCQLQNIKSKYCIPVKPARCSNIQDVLKHTLVHKLTKVQLNSQASKENTQSVLIDLEGSEKTPVDEKSSDLKLEWFQQWHPGYRKVGGLLSANHNVTYVRRQTFITAVSSFPHEEHYNSYLQQRLNVMRDKSEIIDLCDSDSTKPEFKRMKFEISPGNKKSINSVISKQKNNFIMSTNVSKSSVPQKLHFNQSANNKPFICKRTSNNVNGTLPAKVKRQDGMVNIISPVYGKINKTCL